MGGLTGQGYLHGTMILWMLVLSPWICQHMLHHIQHHVKPCYVLFNHVKSCESSMLDMFSPQNLLVPPGWRCTTKSTSGPRCWSGWHWERKSIGRKRSWRSWPWRPMRIRLMQNQWEFIGKTWGKLMILNGDSIGIHGEGGWDWFMSICGRIGLNVDPGWSRHQQHYGDWPELVAFLLGSVRFAAPWPFRAKLFDPHGDRWWDHWGMGIDPYSTNHFKGGQG